MLTELMSEELVLPDIKATDRDAALAELVQGLALVRTIDSDDALSVLLHRERIGSTGVGSGFAIPHGKLRALDSMIACFARSSSGVEFRSLDGKPAHLFLMLLAPEGSAGLHLKALARASRLFRDPGFRERLLATQDRTALLDLLRTQEGRLARADQP